MKRFSWKKKKRNKKADIRNDPSLTTAHNVPPFGSAHGTFGRTKIRLRSSAFHKYGLATLHNGREEPANTCRRLVVQILRL